MSGFNCWGQGVCARVILVLRECIWNASAVLLVLPTFDDTDSLGSPPRQLVYLPGSTLGECFPFPCGEYGGSAKTHHFFFITTFPCFPVSLILLNPQPYNSFECCLLRLLLHNIYICYVIFAV